MKALITSYSTLVRDVLRILLRAVVVGSIVTAACAAYAKDLWEDHNPYSTTGQIGAGTVLKLVVEAPVIVEYEYERKSDDKATIKITPDQGITDFLPAANSDKAISGAEKIILKAKSRLNLRLAVTVQGDATADTLQISGSRVIGYENDRARQQIQITGRINRRDVTQDMTVHSDQVADLVIVITGAPIPQTADIALKAQPDAAAAAAAAEEAGLPSKPGAQLSEEDKQRLLLEYINRILGESK